MSNRKSDWHAPPDWLWRVGTSLVVLCVAVCGSLVLPTMAWLKSSDWHAICNFGLGAGFVGICLLFLARLPLYRERRYWTIGPRPLDRRHRVLYWLAYAFVAAALVLLGVAWLRTAEVSV